MRLCRYDDDRLGVVRGDMVHDVSEAQSRIRDAAPYAMKGDAVIAALPAWRSRLEEMAAKAPGQPVSQVRLLSPVARPSKLVAAPTNYTAHIDEMAARAATQNIKPSPAIGTAGLFLKANSSLIGPSEGVAIRFPERRNEHEVELAIIFGKQGSDIPRDQALDYIAGYAIGLDMTARGPEDRSFRKSIDSYSVLGPWLVTADEIPDPDNVPLTISVNGEMKQSSNTGQLIYDCRKLIEWGSTFYTFYPGDVLYTGTPEGVSPVQPGDTMLAKIDPIGEMTIAVRAHTRGSAEGVFVGKKYLDITRSGGELWGLASPRNQSTDISSESTSRIFWWTCERASAVSAWRMLISKAMRAGRCNTSTRSPISMASLIWWVMNTAVLPFCRTSRTNSARRSRAVISSSEENGSSQSKSSGSTAKARAIDTRWRMPPDSACG